MSDYNLASAVDVTVTVRGKAVRVGPDQLFGTNDPCEFVEFLNAWETAVKAQGGDARFQEATPDFVLDAWRDCTRNILADALHGLPSALPSGPVDAAAGDGAPAHNEESAQSLDAPAPAVQAEVSGTRAPALSVAAPGEKLHDPRAPLSEGEIADAALAAGVPPQELDEAVESARHNDPVPGQPHHDHSRSRREQLDAAADPVALFSGEFTLEVTDVEIPSPGQPLRFRRLYRSGAVFFGPFGYQWDHNYNVSLRPLLDGGAAIWTGRLHEHVYKPNAEGGFDAPYGVFRTLEHHPATAAANEHWILREPHGTFLRFERPQGWPRPYVVPLVAIEDRCGNRHTLEYSDAGFLAFVRDAFGRFLRFTYGECDLLEQLEDHTGRRWVYFHHEEIEHLARVVAPATAEFPDGRSVHYEYDHTNAHPALRHNLIAVVSGDGRIGVENVYGEDPATDDFGRVVRQEYEGEAAYFHAERLQAVPHTPEAMNVPALRVEVVILGRLFVYTFNHRGDLLDKRFRLSDDGSYRLVPETFRYDEQGNLIEHFLADGRGMTYEYDVENPDPLARGNLLRSVQHAAPAKPSAAIEVFRATYEPHYQQLRTVRDPFGATTTFVYDYESLPAGRGNLVEVRHPQFLRADGRPVRPVEKFAYNARGQLTRHERNGAVHEWTYAADGTIAAQVSTKNGESVRQSYERDALGRIRARIDGNGVRHEYVVDADDHLAEVRKPDGVVWTFEYDMTGRLRAVLEPRGDYDDPVLAGRPIRHELRYSPTGFITEEVRGANTAAPRRYRYRHDAEGRVLFEEDPAGRRTVRKYDERGLVLEEQQQDTTGETLRRRTFIYERTGELRKTQIEGAAATNVEYDGFGRAVEVILPGGTQVSLAYDRRSAVTDVQVLGRTGAGEATGLLARRRFEYDEVGALRRRIDVLFDAPAGPFRDVVTTFWRDEGSLVERVVHPNGLEEQFTYDALDRPMEVRDSAGNRTRWISDAAGRVVAVETREAATDGSTATFLRTLTLDAQGRPVADTDSLGNTTRCAYDARGLPRAITGANGNVLELLYDAFGDVVEKRSGGNVMRWLRGTSGDADALVDPAGRTTQLGYDALGRLTSMTRADGLARTFAWTPDGALRRVIDFNGTRVDYTNSPIGLPVEVVTTPAAGVAPTPPVRYVYDGLHRIVRGEHGPSVVTRAYDSFSRLREEVANATLTLEHDAAGLERRIHYGDGRRDVQSFDPLGRLLETRLDRAGALPLAAHGFKPGDTLAKFTWAGALRPASIVAAKVSTEYAWDRGARLVRLATASGPKAVLHEQILFRDALGLARAERRVAGPAIASATKLDALVRVRELRQPLPANALPASAANLTQAQLDAAIAAAAASSAPRSEWLYTPGDAPQSRTDLAANGAVVATVPYATNLLHQVTAVGATPVVYDANGDVIAFGARTFLYDGFRRLVAVQSRANVVARIAYDAFGRVHELERGPTRTRFSYLGDELLQTLEGTAVRWQFSSGLALDQPVLAHSAAGSFVLARDETGSLVAVADPAGRVVDRYRYALFGEPAVLAPDGVTAVAAPASGLAPHFQGRPWLAEAGLYDFRNRAFDPQLLGFLQPDPIPFGDSWNPYVFARYNPRNFVDPYGELPTIVAGAIIGAGLGLVSALISGGDAGDIATAIVSGAIAGGLAGAGLPILGGAAAGALSGGVMGARLGSNTRLGAVGGFITGAIVGAGLGVVGGYVGARVGTAAGTRVYATVFKVASKKLSGASVSMAARVTSMAAGGATGGAASGALTSGANCFVVDAYTGGETTVEEVLWAAGKGALISGAMGSVGAVGERMTLYYAASRQARGQWRNTLGAEGEMLVGRAIGRKPADQSESITVDGRRRKPEFLTEETGEHMVEVKNKARLSQEDVAQLEDYAAHAQGLGGLMGGTLTVYHRPGMSVAPISHIPNLTTLPIPQTPLVVTIPFATSPAEPKKPE